MSPDDRAWEPLTLTGHVELLHLLLWFGPHPRISYSLTHRGSPSCAPSSPGSSAWECRTDSCFACFSAAVITLTQSHLGRQRACFTSHFQGLAHCRGQSGQELKARTWNRNQSRNHGDLLAAGLHSMLPRTTSPRKTQPTLGTPSHLNHQPIKRPTDFHSGQ